MSHAEAPHLQPGSTTPGTKPESEGRHSGSQAAEVSPSEGWAQAIANLGRSSEFKYHGNWGGPGYSGGKFTQDPDWEVPSTDALDEIFKRHDYDYGRMDKRKADALAVQRMQELDARHLLGTMGWKAQLAALGFHAMNLGNDRVVDGYIYPWDLKKAMTAAPPHPAPAAPRPLRSVLRPTAHSRSSAAPALTYRPDPKVLTATAMAVEPNPGESKRRMRSKSAKRTRSASGTRKSSRKRSSSRKPRRSRSASRKRGGTGGPRPGPPPNMKQRAQGVPFTRTDLLYSGQVSGTAAPGTVLFSACVNPSGLPFAQGNSINAVYLNYEAAKWEMFDCEISFRVKATGATTIAGTFTHGIDSDVTDALPSGSIASVQRLTGQGGSTHTWAAGGTTSYNKWNNSKSVPRYWVQPELAGSSREAAKGKYWLIINEPTTSYFAAGSGQAVNVNYQVFIDYTFRFYNATLEITTAFGSSVAGIYQHTDGTNVAAVSPFGIAHLPAVPTTVPTSAKTLPTIFANDGSLDYMYFPINTTFDSTNYVLITWRAAGTAQPPTVGVSGGASIAYNTTDVKAGSFAYGTWIIGLAETATSYAPASQVQKIAGGWRANLGTPTIQSYGYMACSASSEAAITALDFTITAFSPYVASFSDKMLLQAGPGNTDYKYVQTWHYDMPLEDHIRICRTADEAKDQDVKSVIDLNRRLAAEIRVFEMEKGIPRQAQAPQQGQARDRSTERKLDDYDEVDSPPMVVGRDGIARLAVHQPETTPRYIAAPRMPVPYGN